MLPEGCDVLRREKGAGRAWVRKTEKRTAALIYPGLHHANLIRNIFSGAGLPKCAIILGRWVAKGMHVYSTIPPCINSTFLWNAIKFKNRQGVGPKRRKPSIGDWVFLVRPGKERQVCKGRLALSKFMYKAQSIQARTRQGHLLAKGQGPSKPAKGVGMESPSKPPRTLDPKGSSIFDGTPGSTRGTPHDTRAHGHVMRLVGRPGLQKGLVVPVPAKALAEKPTSRRNSREQTETGTTPPPSHQRHRLVNGPPTGIFQFSQRSCFRPDWHELTFSLPGKPKDLLKDCHSSPEHNPRFGF